MSDISAPEIAPITTEMTSPVVAEPDLPMVWPHEAGQLRRWAGFMAREGAKSVITSADAKVERAGKVMRRINGEGSEPLADKFKFTDIVREIGYTAPRQALVSLVQTPVERTQQTMTAFPDGEERVICKPYNGSGGRGIVEMRAADLSTFVSSVGQDYIVQERMPIQAEIRYIRQIDEASGRILRVYDDKTIPKIQGDGTKTKRQLIRHSEIPFTSKLATARQNLESLRDIVPEEGSIHVSSLGVPVKDTLEWGPENGHRVANMDQFMKRFLTDLQAAIGHPLPFLCFDMGIIDTSALDGEYDFEKMKRSVVPLECQMPFTLGGYIVRSHSNPSGVGKTTTT